MHLKFVDSYTCMQKSLCQSRSVKVKKELCSFELFYFEKNKIFDNVIHFSCLMLTFQFEQKLDVDILFSHLEFNEPKIFYLPWWPSYETSSVDSAWSGNVAIVLLQLNFKWPNDIILWSILSILYKKMSTKMYQSKLIL